MSRRHRLLLRFINLRRRKAKLFAPIEARERAQIRQALAVLTGEARQRYVDRIINPPLILPAGFYDASRA